MHITKVNNISSFRANWHDMERQLRLEQLIEEQYASQRTEYKLPKQHVIPSDVVEIHNYPQKLKLELLDANINYFKKQPSSEYNSKLIQTFSVIRSYLFDLKQENSDRFDPHSTLIG